MSWLERIQTDRTAGSRVVRDLIADHRYREALVHIDSAGGPEAPAWAAEVSQRAAVHWLRQAENACHRGDRSQMNSALAEAARYYRDDLGPVFREARRRIRSRILELTVAGHWVVLLHASADQRAVHFASPSSQPPPAYAAFINDRLVARAARRLELDALDTETLDRADTAALEAARGVLRKVYPDSLHPDVDKAPGELVRAVLQVALGRPDLAVLPLLELPSTQPLVCLERARVAYTLGFPGTAMLALADFRTNHGRHETIRRLHTGVFMAQMATHCGDVERAVQILEEVPLHQTGRRPLLLYAQLLGTVGRADEARGVLAQWLSEHPDDEEARTALQGTDAQLMETPD